MPVRSAIAMFTALSTNAVSAMVEKALPTIFLLKQSRTAQQYTLPSWAGCSVIPVHHSWLERLAVKTRFTRSAGVCTPSSGWPRRLGPDRDGHRAKWTLFGTDADYAQMSATQAGPIELPTKLLRDSFPAFQPGWVIDTSGGQ